MKVVANDEDFLKEGEDVDYSLVSLKVGSGGVVASGEIG